MTTFRDSIIAISPPWLSGLVGGALQFTNAIGLDAVAQWTIEGVKASMPGIGTPDALPYIGRDRNIDRGPTETDAAYAARLSAAFDTWATAGTATTLLQQFNAYFSPNTATPLYLVANNSTWHSINTATNAVTKTPNAGNWTWDANAATAWARGWVIIDSTNGPWTPDYWSSTDSSVWGDGGTWGSSAPLTAVSQLNSLLDKWRPANVSPAQIIVMFSSTLFIPSNAPGTGPGGMGNLAVWQAMQNAMFWSPI